jgi:sulfoacetaldehyde dehydrogenase
MIGTTSARGRGDAASWIGDRPVIAAAEDDEARVRELLERSRAALRVMRGYGQERVDEIVTAVAWAACKPENARALAKLELADAGMGNEEDKTQKIQSRVFGTIAQLRGVRSVGVIDVDAATGITKIAKPKGVIGALTPSTNAVAGLVQNALAALKGRNTVIFSPQPRTSRTARETCRLIHGELAKLGAPADLVLAIDGPTRASRDVLLRSVDVVLATGGASLVKHAYSSGRPAIGVGPGNAVTVVDGTSDVREAASKIARGKTFDYATSCSSENAVVAANDVYAELLASFADLGGYVLDPVEKQKLEACLWRDGRLAERMICRAPAAIARAANLSPAAEAARFFIVEESGVGPAYPFSGEKLSVVLAAYRYDAFDRAVALVESIVGYQGRGHSCGIHSTNEEHILRLAEAIDVCRVLVNQVQSAGNSGSFENGLPFTATLGCGSWGGNSVDENVTWKDCVNITRLARPIPSWRPSEETIFGRYHAKYGR